MIRYVLASASLRRKELLELIGLDFEISPAQGEEVITKKMPSEVVEELSFAKASETAQRYIGKYTNDTVVIIGADTVVTCEGEIMGKPRDGTDAKRMLAQLQNNKHAVYTGVTLLIMERGMQRQQKSFHEKTEVLLYPMTEKQIEAYVATGEPMDKAGAYAIQGKCAAYIKEIHGEYNNVVGLPVARLMQELLDLKLVSF